MSTDARGVQRGGCNMCGCAGYDGGSEGKKCMDCNHPPAKHVNLSSASSGQTHASPAPAPALMSAVSFTSPSSGDSMTRSLNMTNPQDPKCQYPGCSQEAHFDMNSRTQFQFCQAHEGMPLPVRIPVQGPPVGIPAQGPPPPVPMDQTSDDISSPQPPPPPAPGRQSLFSLFTSQMFPHKRAEGMDQSGDETMLPPPQRPATAPQIHPSQSLPYFKPLAMAAPPAPPPVPADQQCKLRGCTKRKYTEPTGRVHDFCGIRHAREYEQQTSTVSAELQCKTTGCFRQRYKSDAGTYFDYCSLYCRDNGIKTPTASASTPNMDLTANGPCSLPGCTTPKYRDPANGRIHDFCGRTHAHQARMQGITIDAVNIRRASQQELTIIKGKFQQKWASGKGACPAISFVFTVTNQKLTQRWQAYRSKLQKNGVEEYYHGTKITCNITAVNTLCNDEHCGVCGISRIGLDRRCIQKNISFQRFGHGFYLAPNSSKCHDYTQGRHGYRAMILFEVCPGNKYCVKKTDTSFKSPPQGFDSVYGQAGVSLNYEELVVYNPDAALPKYIIVYQRDGEAKIAK